MFRIITILLKSFDKLDFFEGYKFNLLKDVINQAILLSKDKDIIVLPAGLFTVGYDISSEKSLEICNKISKQIKSSSKDILITFGIDSVSSKNQLAFAVSKDGLIACGRKFYPTKDEKSKIIVAKSPFEIELEKSRIISWNNKLIYLALCYDSFGLKDYKNPNIDIILNFIHGFNKIGEGHSGDVYFAKYGLAKSSLHWNCKTFASCCYFQRDIPKNWPTGVELKDKNIDLKNWTYDNNLIKPKDIIEKEFKNVDAMIKFYDIE